MKTVLHALMGIVLYLLTAFVALPVDLLIPNAALAELVICALRIGLLLLLVRLYCKHVLHISLTDCRVRRPGTLAPWVVCAVALPLLVSGFFLLFVPGTLSGSGLPARQGAELVAVALFNVCIAAGVTEELIFRGYIMGLVERRWGRTAAVIAPSILFGLVHVINVESPNVQDVTMLLVSGTLVGVMFSLITLQSGSIWPAALVHGLWNLVVIGGILTIDAAPEGISLYTYALESGSTLLTGGAYGIETSVPAMVGYGLVAALAVVLGKRRAE